MRVIDGNLPPNYLDLPNLSDLPLFVLDSNFICKPDVEIPFVLQKLCNARADHVRTERLSIKTLSLEMFALFTTYIDDAAILSQHRHS